MMLRDGRKLKNKYRVVNYYENNSVSKMNPNKIYELDYEMMNCKRNLFTGNLKNKSNVAVMELDGNLFYSHRNIHYKNQIGFINFKGNKEKLVLLLDNPIFKTFEVKNDGIDRRRDSEAKLFEFAATIVSEKNHDLKILSELASCESCLGVMKQFVDKFPNTNVQMVSCKQSRMDSTKGKVSKHRWKKKNT